MEDDEELPPFYDCEREYVMAEKEDQEQRYANRDVLWGEMAEGIRNTVKSVDKIEKHLDQQNKAILKNTITGAENKMSNKNLWRVAYLIIALLAGTIGLYFGL